MEIMVVIVILGILAVMSMGSFTASQRKSRDLKRKSDITAIGKALEMYYNDEGKYPSVNANGEMVACTDAACAWGTGQMTNKGGQVTYMTQIPDDPKGAYSYFYDTDDDGTYFQLYVRLENEDDSVVLVDNVPAYYEATKCISAVNGWDAYCNYGISSTNVLPSDGHNRLNAEPTEDPPSDPEM